MKEETGKREARRPKIPHEFINDAFVGFLSSLLPLRESNRVIQRPISGEGSIQELIDDFQLSILHGIDLSDILVFLEREGKATINRQENSVQYRTKDIAGLIDEITNKK